MNVFSLKITPMQSHLPECRCFYVITDKNNKTVISSYDEGDEKTRLMWSIILDALNNHDKFKEMI